MLGGLGLVSADTNTDGSVGGETNPNPNPFEAKIGYVKSRGGGRIPKRDKTLKTIFPKNLKG